MKKLLAATALTAMGSVAFASVPGAPDNARTPSADQGAYRYIYAEREEAPENTYRFGEDNAQGTAPRTREQKRLYQEDGQDDSYMDDDHGGDDHGGDDHDGSDHDDGGSDD